MQRVVEHINTTSGQLARFEEAVGAGTARRFEAILQESESLVKRAFEQIDTDGNGSISVDEFIAFVAEYGLAKKEDTLAMFKDADLSGDNELDLAEFGKFLFRLDPNLDLRGAINTPTEIPDL